MLFPKQIRFNILHMISRILTLVFLFFTGILFAQLTENRTERIISFHSEIHVRKNCTADITERITVYAGGVQIQHGIFRDLPLYYEFEGGETEVGFQLNKTLCDGKSVDYHTEDLSNGIRIYLGDKESFVSPGIHTYEISYTVDHVLNIGNNKFDELYWNVNGLGWEFTIDTVSAAVYFPKGATVKEINAYTGSEGSSGNDYTAKTMKDHVFFVTTRTFGAHENLTFSVTWNKGKLHYPTASEEFIYWIKTHFLWVVGGFGFIVTIFFSFLTWIRYGRDPKPGTIMPQYEAPEDFSPAGAAHIYNYSRGRKNLFTSQLIGLAVKGRVTVHVDDPGGIFSTKAYTIRKTDSSEWKKEPLHHEEHTFYEDLFRQGSIVVMVSKSYNPHLKAVQDNLSELIVKNHGSKYMNKRNGLKARQFLFTLGILAAGLIGKYFFGGAIWVLLLFVFASIITNVVFGLLFEQPTAEGRKIMDHLAGFKMYMAYTDKERIRLMNPPTMNFEHFEKNLPYAIALGVSEEWAKQFDPKEMESHTSSPHYWYTGALFAGFHAHSFDFSGLSSTISSAATPPSKSSGSGGGGFSGGGGGGGGGGGW